MMQLEYRMVSTILPTLYRALSLGVFVYMKRMDVVEAKRQPQNISRHFRNFPLLRTYCVHVNSLSLLFR